MRRILLVLAATVALVMPLRATVVIPTEFREVVASATTIVRGRVTDVRAVLAQRNLIETIGTVAVDAVLKGPSASFVYVRVQGGEIGRDRHVAVGAPQLTVGEQAVFFLRRGSDNTMRPVGLTMGVYRVKAETGTGRPVIDPPLLAGQTASVGTVVRGDARRKPMAVQEFESLVRLVMAAQASAGGGR